MIINCGFVSDRCMKVRKQLDQIQKLKKNDFMGFFKSLFGWKIILKLD